MACFNTSWPCWHTDAKSAICDSRSHSLRYERGNLTSHLITPPHRLPTYQHSSRHPSLPLSLAYISRTPTVDLSIFAPTAARAQYEREELQDNSNMDKVCACLRHSGTHITSHSHLNGIPHTILLHVGQVRQMMIQDGYSGFSVPGAARYLPTKKV